MAEIKRKRISDKDLTTLLLQEEYHLFNQLVYNPNLDFFNKVDRHTMYEVIDSMLNDDQISGDLETFKSFVLAENYDLRLPNAYLDDPTSLEYRESYEDYLTYKGGRFFVECNKLLESIEYGSVICEIMWEDPALNDGKYYIEKLVPMPHWRFGYTVDGEIYDLLNNEILNTEEEPYKYISMTHNPRGNNMYGRSILTKAYWPWTFKKESIKANIMYVKKSILPSIIALMKASANKTDVEDNAETIADELRKLANSSGVAMANVESIETIQATSKGEELISMTELFDRMISKAIIGSETLTNDTKYGNKSANEIQVEIVEKRARHVTTGELQPPINELLQMHLILNYSSVAPEKVPYLSYSYRYDPTFDETIAAQEAGIPFSLEWWRDKYGLQAPVDDDDKSVSDLALLASQDVDDPNRDFFLQQKRQSNKAQKTNALYGRIRNLGSKR